jgi:hypothetical protein
LGPPLFSDGFDDPSSGWPIRNDGYATLGYVGGEYQIYLKSARLWRVGTPVLSLPARYRVEAVARRAIGQPTSLGLAFDMVPNVPYPFYLFYIDPDYGEYALERRVCTSLSACDWMTLIDWTFHSAINPLEQRNHLRVDRIGNSIQLYINDVNVNSYIDPEPTAAGRDAGLYAESYDAVGGALTTSASTVCNERRNRLRAVRGLPMTGESL